MGRHVLVWLALGRLVLTQLLLDLGQKQSKLLCKKALVFGFICGCITLLKTEVFQHLSWLFCVFNIGESAMGIWKAVVNRMCIWHWPDCHRNLDSSVVWSWTLNPTWIRKQWEKFPCVFGGVPASYYLLWTSFLEKSRDPTCHYFLRVGRKDLT